MRRSRSPEVPRVLPGAAELRPGCGRAARLLGATMRRAAQLGYVLRTMPDVGGIIGYRGWSDTLVAFDPALHVVGVRLRESRDTREHVQDIRDDRYYLKTWNGKSWDEVARTTPKDGGHRGSERRDHDQHGDGRGDHAPARERRRPRSRCRPPPIAHGWREIGLGLVIAAALVLAWVGHVRAALGAARVSGPGHRLRGFPHRRSARAIAHGRVGRRAACRGAARPGWCCCSPRRWRCRGPPASRSTASNSARTAPRRSCSHASRRAAGG